MEKLIKLIGLVALVVAIGLLLSFPTMILWNWLMSDVFGLPEITFTQALVMNVLSSIFFKNNN